MSMTHSLGVVLLAVSACDPGITISGHVTVDGGSLAGATVSLICPPTTKVTVSEVTTGADGAFTLTGTGCVSTACGLQVRAANQTVARARVSGCHDTTRYCGYRDCNHAEMQLQVKPLISK